MSPLAALPPAVRRVVASVFPAATVAIAHGVPRYVLVPRCVDAPVSVLRRAGCALVETAVRDRIIARDVYALVRAPEGGYRTGGRTYATRETAESIALRAAADEIALAFCDSCRADVDAVVAGRVAV